MSDNLADVLRLAGQKLTADRDTRMVRSFLAQHETGKELTSNQLYWARILVERAGLKWPGSFATVEGDLWAKDAGEPAKATPARSLAEQAAVATSDADRLNLANEQKLTQIIERVLGGEVQKLVEVNDERERNLAARQEAFNKNAAKSIANAVVDEALKRLDARVPRQTVITVKRTDGIEWKSSDPEHPQFEKLLKYLSLRKADGFAPGIFLAGERGSGKTTGCRHAAKAYGLKWYSNGAISDPVEMLGYRDANGNYHTTPFRQAYEFGGLYTFDEVDRSDPNALLAVNPHLANNEAAFPDGMVKRHPDCLLTATGNTWGLGGSLEFSGACKLDEAFLSRYEIKLPWDVDLQFERKIVGNNGWMDYVAAARRRVREAGIKYTIDSRAALAGATMIAQLGYTYQQAAADTYLASMKADQRQIAEGTAR